MLITAWAQVVAVCPDWKLHIWGEGELREQLQSQIDRMGLDESCFLEGRTDNVAEKYVENSVFVLSSRFEGVCNGDSRGYGVWAPCCFICLSMWS